MKLLLTNDDGIEAPGLQALLDAAAPLGEVVVAAPGGPPSGPVRVPLHELAPDAAWVLAGINQGGNLGADVWHSGTVAAVREAVLHGYRGIAFSQYIKRGQLVSWK